MKNKKALFIVLPATILVWVVAFMRIFNTLSPTNDSKNNYNLPPPQSKISSIPDTFSIVNNYRDPFEIKLAQQTFSGSHVNVSKTEQSKPKKETITQTKWPQILYSGTIKNQKSNKQLALVQVNGSLQTLKTGDIIEGIKIGKIYKDSLEVTYNSEKRFLKK